MGVQVQSPKYGLVASVTTRFEGGRRRDEPIFVASSCQGVPQLGFFGGGFKAFLLFVRIFVYCLPD